MVRTQVGQLSGKHACLEMMCRMEMWKVLMSLLSLRHTKRIYKCGLKQNKNRQVQSGNRAVLPCERSRRMLSSTPELLLLWDQCLSGLFVVSCLNSGRSKPRPYLPCVNPVNSVTRGAAWVYERASHTCLHALPWRAYTTLRPPCAENRGGVDTRGHNGLCVRKKLAFFLCRPQRLIDCEGQELQPPTRPPKRLLYFIYLIH